MGKLLILSSLLVPLAFYLACFSGPGFDPESLKGQRVLITGASSGIGEQLAYQYAKLGARLVITARREGLLKNVSKVCKELGAQEVHFVAADMAIPADRDRVIKFVEKHMGGLDNLILNHAVMIQEWWTGSEENLINIEKVMNLNVFAYVDLASKSLTMLTASRGRIGIVSSGFAEFGTKSISMYSSSKFALSGFFAALRQELRHKDTGVSVTIVVLGPVSTESFLELNKENMPGASFLTPEDAARGVLESVAQRLYNVRHDWKMKVGMLINDLFPQFTEDFVASMIQIDSTVWSTASVLQSIARSAYSS